MRGFLIIPEGGQDTKRLKFLLDTYYALGLDRGPNPWHARGAEFLQRAAASLKSIDVRFIEVAEKLYNQIEALLQAGVSPGPDHDLIVTSHFRKGILFFDTPAGSFAAGVLARSEHETQGLPLDHPLRKYFPSPDRDCFHKDWFRLIVLGQAQKNLDNVPWANHWYKVSDALELTRKWRKDQTDEAEALAYQKQERDKEAQRQRERDPGFQRQKIEEQQQKIDQLEKELAELKKPAPKK